MADEFVVGVDVAGEKRGFHAAVLGFDSNRVGSIFHATEPGAVVKNIREQPGESRLIAVDAPPRARRESDRSRLAERELNRAGYSVLWTPAGPASRSAGGWMENGAALWKQLEGSFPESRLIETFPTASSDGLASTGVSFPLALIEGPEVRKDVADYVDAAVCAVTARQFCSNRAGIRTYGADPDSSPYDDEKPDELGPIHVLKPQA